MKHDIVTSYRDDNVRASFHFYNNEDDVESFIAAMKKLRGSLGPADSNAGSGAVTDSGRCSGNSRVARRRSAPILPMAECIDLMQRTMIAVSEGRVVLPLRSILVMPGDRGMMGMMPGYLAEPECFGVKLVSLIPRNKPPQYSSHLGLVLLFEAEHGRPVALLDAAEITAIRTAAASGLATRLLARPEAGDLAMLGAGEQARSHLEAMLSVRPLRRVRVWARDAAKATSFRQIRRCAGIGSPIETSATVHEAVAGADIICTTTKARDRYCRATG